MKTYIYIALSLLSLLVTSSCNREDNIDLIFHDKTYYMTGGELNDVALNQEVTHFYRDENGNPYGKSAYYIHFTSETFTIVLTPGEEYTGRWTADGKTRLMSMNIKNEHSPSKVFDRNIYAVLKQIRYYEGDSKQIILYSDRNNFIRLYNER